MGVLERSLFGEPRRLDRAARAHLPGSLAQLSDGKTYYQSAGPANGRPVILIHGFSMPSFIWDPTFSALAQAGFHAIRYDLYGRGWSDRPQQPYDKALFVRQLAELMEALKLPQASLVSLSMGGVIAAEFAFRFLKRVRGLSFIDPAGFDLGLPAAVKAVFWPGVGELLLGMLGRMGRKTLLESMLADFYQPSPEEVELFKARYFEQMQYQGFKRALLSSLRNGMLDEDLQLYRRLGERPQLPVQLVWGELDDTVPFRHAQTFVELVPHTEFHPIALAKHIPHFDRPELVNPLLVEFLGRDLA